MNLEYDQNYADSPVITFLTIQYFDFAYTYI